jgi:hypothetical protein
MRGIRRAYRSFWTIELESIGILPIFNNSGSEREIENCDEQEI